jgi:hypothetical protein
VDAKYSCRLVARPKSNAVVTAVEGNALMEERKILEEDNVTVTTRRVVFGSKVYSVDEISSARLFPDQSWKGALIFIGIGLAVLWFGGPPLFGLGAIVAGILFGYYVRTENLMLLFRGDEYKLIPFGRNRKLIQRICAAINKAIESNYGERQRALDEDLSHLKRLDE